jgi:hypothetical protein
MAPEEIAEQPALKDPVDRVKINGSTMNIKKNALLQNWVPIRGTILDSKTHIESGTMKNKLALAR